MVVYRFFHTIALFEGLTLTLAVKPVKREKNSIHDPIEYLPSLP